MGHFRCGRRVLSVFLVIVFFPGPGCGGVFTGEKTLKKDGLTLTYRSVNRIAPDINIMDLRHPVRISQDMVRTHLLSLRYGDIGLHGKEKPVFTRDGVDRMSRLLTKALNQARSNRYVHFEFESSNGPIAGEVFAGNDKIHWVFTTINGVDYSNDPLGLRKRTWKLTLHGGQRYYATKTDLGYKARENWIVADLLLPQAGTRSPESARSGQISGTNREPAKGRSPAPDKRKLLRFLKHLHDKGIIDDEEYKREKQELMNKKF